MPNLWFKGISQGELMAEHITWLTQAGYDRLALELAEREGVIRQDIVNKIALAREEGDLKENGGYHAAREEQGKNEGRIQHLQMLLENARVGSPDVPDGEAHIGRLVTVEFAPGENETYLIGAPEESGLTEHDVLSPTSPLGDALVGHRIGDEVSYVLPNGRSITVVLVDVQIP
jgi:transcription elongation factor GreA